MISSRKSLPLRKSLQCYVLVDREPVAATVAEWGDFLQNPARVVEVSGLPGGVRVSTVFVGVNELMFETMIFGGSHDGWQERSASWDEALIQHRAACAAAQT